MNFVFLAIGFLVGAAVVWLYLQVKSSQQNTEAALGLQGLDKELAIVTEKFQAVSEDKKRILNDSLIEKEQLKNELQKERELLAVANARLARAEEAFKGMNEKLSNEKQEKEALQKNLLSQFENIASKILEDKSVRFTEQNKINLDIILTPLKEKIKTFEEKVDKAYKEESAERITLKAEIKNLVELNKQVSEEANNLAKALKGDNKMQGNWGEVILEKILERSGLAKDSEYITQFQTSNESGKTIKPDVVVLLPDNKHIVIDSKVSLTAYESFVNADDESLREKFSKEHIGSVKNHIKLLSEKNYQASSEFNTPDFVLMFIPIESSFSMAIQSDAELFNFAWERKIVMVSPSTLLATLRTISSLWKQEKQTKNALEIAKQGGALYDKFVGFVEDLEKIGKSIDTTQIAYSSAMNKLQNGSGNLIKRVQDIEKLGAKTTKSLSDKYLEKNDNQPLKLEQ
ncbi:MAG TPA: DNA recombination protein RmuC [Bacteroidia bacterium]|nr:DNA recombination protein RmuC [Bacteroidia bacterium]HRH07476.1 DNA recombination protein RmuC [Bacteroidia bacterium]